MESCPAARLMMIWVTKKGEIPWRGPLACKARWVDSRVATPPMPDPMKQPLRSPSSPSKTSPASSMAMVPAALANWMNRSDMDDRASRAEIQRVGSNALTSPANRVENSPASKRVMGATPASRRKLSGVEARDGSDTRDAPEQRSPGFLGADPHRGDQPDAGHRYPAWHGHSLLRARLDVVDHVADGLDLLGILIGNFQVEGLFNRQHELDDG